MKRISFLLMAALAVPACSSDSSNGDDTSGDDTATPTDEWDKELAKREYDYNAALRIAALRLTGDLPSMAEILQVANAADLPSKKVAYEALLTEYMNRPTFARQMFFFWRDTFKMGETAELDFAPTYAAQVAVQNMDYRNLFTAAQGTCPTLDIATGTFTPGNCTYAGPKAGVLTDKGAMKHFFGNFAFRRVKWIQETFDCLKFPVEIDGTPQDVGAASPYTGTWPFQSIAGTNNGGRVNFLDTSAVICANCHQTLNHIAPLFAQYDEMGDYKDVISVPTPIDGAPMARLTDYLPPGETTAWRYQVPAADLPALGAAIAADKDVAKCGVARVWNWAMGKQDIVDALHEVPVETIQAQLDAFISSGYKMKDLIFAVYTADDFVKF
ncbi:MAG TPA: hypothetical protein VK427_26830 [Kofleriaceae bacterium]|nr:hypothetical protein [Kofleriaceae bacterium]